MGKLELASLRATLPSLALAAGFAIAAAWWAAKLWEAHLGHATLVLKIGAVFGPGLVASLAYWLVAFAAKVPAAREITGLVAQKFRR